MLERERASVRPEHYARFQSLARARRYDRAILCGEAILQQQGGRCDEQAGPERVAGEAIRLEDPQLGARARPHPRPERPPEEKRALLPAEHRTEGTAAATAPSEPPVEPRPAPSAAGRRGARRFLAPILVLASGAALLAAGGGLAGAAQARHDELSRTCPLRDPACSTSAIDGGRGLAIGADVLFGVGGAAVLAGAILFLVKGRPAPEREAAERTAGVRVRPALGGLLLEGGF